MADIKIIGCMDNTLDNTFESANRVYDINGIAPTIPTSCGGGHTPKVMINMDIIENIEKYGSKNSVYKPYGGGG